MRNSIKYSNEEIILSPPSKHFRFLKWLESFGQLDSYTQMRAEELVEILGDDVVRSHYTDEKKIISFADIPVGANILDSDFLYYSKEYRNNIQYKNNPKLYTQSEIDRNCGSWEYDINLFHIAKLIEEKIKKPEQGLFKTYNNFYLRADNGGIIRLCIYCHPKKEHRFSNSGMEIHITNILDSEEVSGRIFFGCGSVKE